MPVSDAHPQYSFYLPQWEKTRDACAGSARVKARKSIYLPVPDASDQDPTKGTNRTRYKQYIQRAVYTNFVGRTKNALVGAAFRKAPVFELPDNIGYLATDATGDGLSLEQLCKDELTNLLEVGRVCLMVDYPQAEDGMSEEDVRALGLRASIVSYPAESVINWSTETRSGRKLLNLVVIAEKYRTGTDEFSHDSETQHRVLRLREDGYTQQIYRDDKPYTEEYYPRQADGAKWQEIPFVFVGSKNNDSTIDDAPLSDIADVNIAHYCNSADYEESCFLTGQPTLFLTHSLSKEMWDEYNTSGIKLGSRAGHVLGETGNATLVQADANSMVGQAMKDKESQMVMIGARIITDRGQNETAEAARIRFASENSVLGDVVHNLTDGIIQCLKWACLYMGTDEEIEFALNTDFYDRTVDPQMISSMILLLDRGLIGEEDIFKRAKAGGIVDEDRSFDDVRTERGLANPLV